MPEHSDWSALTTLICDDNASVASVASVGSFDTNADAWFDAHADELLHRGIDDPAMLTGIVVLVDALERTGQLVNLDWKSPVDDVVGLLGRLPAIAATSIDLTVLIGPGHAAEADVETVVRWVNGLLAPAEVTVAILDEDSEAYPLVAVPSRAVDTAVVTAGRLGVGVRVLRASAGDIADLLVPAPPIPAGLPHSFDAKTSA